MPFMVGVVAPIDATSAQLCGGVLISQHVALTAAHCTQHLLPGVALLLGGSDIEPLLHPEYPDHLRDTVTVRQVIVHPQYADDHAWVLPSNDIAAVILDDYAPSAFSHPVAPIALPAAGMEAEIAGSVTVFGWGQTPSAAYSPTLNAVSAPVVPIAACQSAYAGQATITDAYLCEGDLAGGGVDACVGDSGGPVAFQPPGSTDYVLGGLVSWGQGCALAGKPGVDVRVSAYRSWLAGVVAAAG